ncbi:hypothetical protein ACFUCV_08055 [Specibacter sp. NPDC057265]|uniref:hypothetical protein n=1 Tax=Specibacter sp. NPDC057265 TaxID=3346075 RepID=UPI0036447F6B
MRTAASALLVIIALLVAAVAGPSLWLQRNIIDEAGFAKLAGPLGGNAEFQGGLTELVSSRATAALNLTPPFSDLAASLVTSAAQQIYTDPAYEPAWTQTLERSHRLTFAAAETSGTAADVKLDIAPIVGMVIGNVSEQVGIPVPLPPELVVDVEQPELARLLPAATTLGGWGPWLAGIAVALIVLALVVAKRRAATTIFLGVGLAVVALGWWLAAGMVQTGLRQQMAGPAAIETLGVELGALAGESWQKGITATFIVAAVLLVAGVVALMVGNRRTT